MDARPNTANVLILASSTEETERVIKSLHDGGIQVRGAHADAPTFKQEPCSVQAFDAIICCSYDTGIDLDSCVACYRELTGAPPLIVVADQAVAPRSLFNAMRNGARELTERGDVAHLCAALSRAVPGLGNRQRGARPAATAQGPEASPAPETSDPGVENDRHSVDDPIDREFSRSISRALQRDQFKLVYQPMASLRGDRQEHYSILLRLPDGGTRLREAKEFLATAVRSGRMVAVDRWVIRHTIAEIANLHERKRKVNLFVNVAAETLQEERLLIWICDYLREYEVRGNWLTIQIAEEHALRHPDAFSRLRDGLRKVKCRIALNRCGLGPDAQGVFENARVDFARLAPELGAELATDERRQARVRRLVEAAREAGTRSIVPHVADPYSLAQLWRMGVDYVQGNFLQVPAPSIDAGN